MALSSYDDKIIAKAALEVLCNIGMEPAVALAIRDSVVCTLQKVSVFNIGFADLAKSILSEAAPAFEKWSGHCKKKIARACARLGGRHGSVEHEAA